MARTPVAVVSTTPETVFEDYRRLLQLAGYRAVLSPERPLVVKLDLSWSRYFPAANTEPWQLDALLRVLREDHFPPESIRVVARAEAGHRVDRGARANLWKRVLERHGVGFVALDEDEWVPFEPDLELPTLRRLQPGGLRVPRTLVGADVVHLPTLKTHAHAVVAGVGASATSALLPEFGPAAWAKLHHIFAEILMLHAALNPNRLAVVDGTVCGAGAGPRTVRPSIQNVLLAGADPVATDALCARLMGFSPMRVEYLRHCTERGFGNARADELEIRGAELDGIDFRFELGRTPVHWEEQALAQGPLAVLGKLMLTPRWRAMSRRIYEDLLWYPFIGQRIQRRFLQTPWGRLWTSYQGEGAPR